MRVNLDKYLDKDVCNTIKTAIGYPPKLAWGKISYINFCKLAQITKKLIILGGLCLPLTQTLSKTSSTHNTSSTSQIIYLRHFKLNNFW